MGLQSGLLGLRGNLGGLVFKTDGTVATAPAKRAVTAQRTKDNNSEFGNAASAGKRLRDGLSKLTKVGSGRYLVSRVVKLMKDAINLDLVSVRGQRNVLDGEVSVFEGFNFNDMKSIASVVVVNFTALITRATGVCTISIPAFTPINDVDAPGGTTHFKIIGESSAINFETGEFDAMTAETAYLPLNATPLASQVLSMNLADNSTNPIFTGVAIEFYQFLNGDYYVLDNASYRVSSILKVDTGI